MVSRRFPELTKTTEAVLIGAAAGASLLEIANEVYLSEPVIRSRVWAAVRHVWRTRRSERRRPETLGEVPVAILLLEAPELALRRESLVEALPVGVNLMAVRDYLGKEGGGG